MKQTNPPEPGDETVEEAAEHADRSVDHRREMQRRAAQSEAAEGPEEAALEGQSVEHERAAQAEEAQADETARAADRPAPG
jgi:hypothetical protein